MFQILLRQHGSNLNIVLELIVIAGALGRAITPVTASVIVASKMSKVNILEIIKKNFFPVILGFSTILVLSLIIMWIIIYIIVIN